MRESLFHMRELESSGPGEFVSSSEGLEDPKKLVYFREAIEKRFAMHQLEEHAANGPHIDVKHLPEQ